MIQTIKKNRLRNLAGRRIAALAAGSALILMAMLPRASVASPRQTLRPITASCIMEAAERHGTPLAALIAILSVEGGQVGMIRRNSNGSYDLGPGQINTIWIPEIRAAGIDPLDVLYDGCVNIDFSARILARQFAAGHSPIEAIGRYHSNTPRYKSVYQQKIVSTLADNQVSIAKLIRKANAPIQMQVASSERGDRS